MSARRLMRCAAVVLLSVPLAAFAQSASNRSARADSAAWVVEMFYAHRSFPEKAAHITGEFKKHYADAATLGAHLPATVHVTSRALMEKGQRAVFATSVIDSLHPQDRYTFLFREDGVWKIEAVRTLSLPRLHYVLLDSLESKRARGTLPDSLVFVAERMRLAVRSDSELKRYLETHLAALRTLADRFAAVRGLSGISVDGEASPAGAVSDAERRALVAELRKSRLGALLHDTRSPACVFLKIGGDGDNYVGFIYAPAGCHPPPLSPYEFIYVEQVVPGWFVYKTT